MGDACNVRDERACTFTGDLHGDLHGLFVALGNGLCGQIPFAGCRIVGAIAFSLDELNARGELIGGLDTGCCTRTVVGDGQGVGDDLTGSELEGCLVDFSGIGDRLLDGGVSQTGECPVLVVVGHCAGAQGDLGGQRQSLVLRSGHIARGGVALSNAVGADSQQGVAVNGDSVVAGAEVLEGVLAVCIGGGRQRLFLTRGGGEGQLDSHACQRLIRAFRSRAAIVVGIPEEGVANGSVSNQAEVDGQVFPVLLELDSAFETVGVLATDSCVGLGDGVALGDREGHLVGCVTTGSHDVIGVREQVLELVLAVCVGEDGFDSLAVRIDNGVTGSVDNGDLHSGDTVFALILDAILVGIEPDVVANCGRLHESEVNVRDIGLGWGQGNRVRGQELALTGLRAIGRGTVTVGLLEVGQLDGFALELCLSGNNLNLVATQGQAVELVVTVGIGLGGDLCAGGILHRVSICVEETHRHTFEGVIDSGRIVHPSGIRVVVDGSRNGAAHSEGSTRGVVVLVRINLVIIAQGCRVRNGLALGVGVDLDQNVECLGSVHRKVCIQIARGHCLPVGVQIR